MGKFKDQGKKASSNLADVAFNGVEKLLKQDPVDKEAVLHVVGLLCKTFVEAAEMLGAYMDAAAPDAPQKASEDPFWN